MAGEGGDAMTDKPVIFSAPMVQALLAGRKTQTRRIGRVRNGVTVANLEWDGPVGTVRTGRVTADHIAVPYAPGDRLYVREAIRFDAEWNDCKPTDFDRADAIHYEADGHQETRAWGDPFTPGRIRPSIHMPRWASRLTLTVTEVRVQRLQEISEADAVAEGVAEVSAAWQDADEPATYPSFQAYGQDACFSGAGAARLSFMTLWSSLHGPDAWATNPWVVAVSFAVQNGNIDAVKPNA